MSAKIGKAQLVLSAACAVLILAIAYELMAPIPTYAVPSVHVAGAVVLPALPGAFVPPSENAFASVTDRPLFDISRKKYVPSSTPAEDKAAPPPLPNLLLVGVILGSDRKLAMLKPSEAALAMSYAVGDQIGGWQVTEIDPDHIVLKSGATEHEITMDANKAPQVTLPSASSTRQTTSRNDQTGQQNTP